MGAIFSVISKVIGPVVGDLAAPLLNMVGMGGQSNPPGTYGSATQQAGADFMNR